MYGRAENTTFRPDDTVVIAMENGVEEITNDTVVVSVGGILPRAFLNTIGIHVETKWGTE